jgi:hypothetical protein
MGNAAAFATYSLGEAFSPLRRKDLRCTVASIVLWASPRHGTTTMSSPLPDQLALPERVTALQRHRHDAHSQRCGSLAVAPQHRTGTNTML